MNGLGRWAVLAAAFVGGIAAVGVGALAYVQTGWFNATAAAPHKRIIAWATHDTMIHSVRLRAKAIAAPPRFTPDEVRAGFALYDDNCAMCHGGPGVARADWVKGLTPTPPFLLSSARGWSPPELFWIIDRGVKMTAMPAWGLSRSRGQVWDLVAFVEALPDLSARDYAAMRAERAQGAGRGGALAAGAPSIAPSAAECGRDAGDPRCASTSSIRPPSPTDSPATSTPG